MLLRRLPAIRFRFTLLALSLLLVLAACEMPLTAPTPTPSQLNRPSATPSEGAQSSEQVFLPEVVQPAITPTTDQSNNPPTVTPAGETRARLAFLKNGDLWLATLPQPEPRRLTSSSDLMTFAWSPDGVRIATFNGRSLCFVDPSGNKASECSGLDLSDDQSIIPRGIVWSPDQSTIVLWNLANPWDDQALGWLVVPLSSPQETARIADPSDYGLTLSSERTPGGFTGQPAFLADGTLIGTLSHRDWCGEGGCRYQLYSFDLPQRKFSPYPNNPEEGWSEGQNLALSADRDLLANFGTFFTDCDSYVTFADIYTLSNSQRKAYNFELEAITSLDFSSDARQAVISRVSGCPSPPEQTTWDRTCGLSQGFDVFPLQILDLESGEREDSFPAVSPGWSPDGTWIVFRSCLAPGASGSYEPTPNGPPSIYILNLSTEELLKVGEGLYPAWSPR